MTEDQKPEQEVKAQPAVMRMTIEVIRAATGKKEVFELVGTPDTTEEAKDE